MSLSFVSVEKPLLVENGGRDGGNYLPSSLSAFIPISPQTPFQFFPSPQEWRGYFFPRLWRLLLCHSVGPFFLVFLVYIRGLHFVSSSYYPPLQGSNHFSHLTVGLVALLPFSDCKIEV